MWVYIYLAVILNVSVSGMSTASRKTALLKCTLKPMDFIAAYQHQKKAHIAPERFLFCCSIETTLLTA